MQLIAMPRTALPLLDVYAPRCAFETLLSAVQCLCVSGSRYDLPLPHKAIIAPPAFAVVVLHATGPRYANEVLCAAGPCYATEVLLATGSCYAIDEIYCATPVRLTALLCVSMPMPRGGRALPKRCFSLLRRSNASLRGSINADATQNKSVCGSASAVLI